MKKLILYLSIFLVLTNSLVQGAQALGEEVPYRHQWLVDKGWVVGREDGDLQLDETMTRAEFVKLIVLARGDRVPINSGGLSSSMLDLPVGHWAKTYIDRGLETGLVKGYPGGMFKPDDNVTYGEVLAVLSRCHRDWDLERDVAVKWPTSYLNFARKEKMLDGVQLSEEDMGRPGVRKMVFAIVYNAFFMELDEKTGVEREPAWLPGPWFFSTYGEEALKEDSPLDTSENEDHDQEDSTEEPGPPVGEDRPEGIVDVSDLLEVDVDSGMLCGFKEGAECPSHLWIPNAISGVPIRKIGAEAFQGVEMEELTLGEGLLAVGESAFKDCKIQKLHLPDSLVRIEKAAFFGNILGQDLALPKGLQSIGDYAFANSQIQGKVQLPEGLKEVGVSAFYHNKIGAEITIPASVESIGGRAFAWNRIKTAVIMGEDTVFTSGHENKDENAFDKKVVIIKAWE